MSTRSFDWPGSEAHLIHTKAARPALCISPEARVADVLAASASMVVGVAEVLDFAALGDGDAADMARGLANQLRAAVTLTELAIESTESA
jgi:hypothetical protein